MIDRFLGIIAFVIYLNLSISLSRPATPSDFNPESPYNQKLADCNKPYHKVVKKTKAKAVLCPMIKDEEGFLSEWIAYYQMHGIDRIDIYDNGSTDNFKEEVKPWIDTGFVRIISKWVEKSEQDSKRSNFFQTIHIKKRAEADCKKNAIADGFEYFFSIDIDEYLIPIDPNLSIVDSMEYFVNKTSRMIICTGKFNFQVTPHILEPVHLLTIEAYRTRMKQMSRMSYYTTVASKCGYALNHPTYTNDTRLYVTECCNFHGCQAERSPAICRDASHKANMYIMQGGFKDRGWVNSFVMNHYSRSLEKFALKSKTWTSATGEVAAGSNIESASRGYSIPTFLSRNLGWYYDDTALRYSCQLRHQLQLMTNESVYLRPGKGWYRNAEFGKEVSDPEKRGRYGRENAHGFKFSESNPYHYHGHGLGETAKFTYNGSSIP